MHDIYIYIYKHRLFKTAIHESWKPT